MWNGSKIGTDVVDGRKDHFYFMRKLVQSAIESGCGYSGLTTILAVVNIKNMHHKTYSRITKELSIDYGKVSIKIYIVEIGVNKKLQCEMVTILYNKN